MQHKVFIYKLKKKLFSTHFFIKMPNRNFVNVIGVFLNFFSSQALMSSPNLVKMSPKINHI